MATSQTGKTSRQLLGFIVVGSIGFIVDASVLTLLIDGHFADPVVARLISIPTAVTVTYFLNRLFTFAEQKSELLGQEYFRYVVVQALGALTNFSVYIAILKFPPTAAVHPVAALAVGSLFGLFVNFIGSRYFVFTADNTENSV